MSKAQGGRNPREGCGEPRREIRRRLLIEAPRRNPEPPVAFPGPDAEPESQAPFLNPRERLDALARLLDRQREQAEGAADTSGGVPGETRTRRQDDSPGFSARRGVDSSPDVE